MTYFIFPFYLLFFLEPKKLFCINLWLIFWCCRILLRISNFSNCCLCGCWGTSFNLCYVFLTNTIKNIFSYEFFNILWCHTFEHLLKFTKNIFSYQRHYFFWCKLHWSIWIL